MNPNCDLSTGAGMARTAAAVGIDYSSLAALLVRYALRRRRVDGPAVTARARANRPSTEGVATPPFAVQG